MIAITRSRIVVLFIATLGLLVSTTSAVVSYAPAYSGLTMYGDCPGGAMVCLGFPVEFIYFYNYISIGFLFLIASSASERNSSFFAILLPLFAGLFAWWRWLVLPSFEQVGGVIICCAVLAVAIYMKNKQQEKFGIAGPGSPFLNIVFWMVVIQASIGFINSMGMFEYNAMITPEVFQNVVLADTVAMHMGAGGVWSAINSVVYLAGGLAISALMMMLNTLLAIVYFKGLVLSIIPFAGGIPVVENMLMVITVGIDVVIIYAIFLWYYKPGAGETA
jgi:hypothetical protein